MNHERADDLTGTIVLAAVLGMIFVLGVSLLYQAVPAGPDHGPVRCSGEIMSPGTVCNQLRDGAVTSSKSYETLKNEQIRGRGWDFRNLALGLGALTLSVGLAAAWIRHGRRRSPEADEGWHERYR